MRTFHIALNNNVHQLKDKHGELEQGGTGVRNVLEHFYFLLIVFYQDILAHVHSKLIAFYESVLNAQYSPEDCFSFKIFGTSLLENLHKICIAIWDH